MLLRREGWHVNVKRVRRLFGWRGCKCGLHRHADAKYCDQVWAMDRMHDELFDGRRLCVLTVVDTWSMMCPVMRVCNRRLRWN
jgi:putative transposase